MTMTMKVLRLMADGRPRTSVELMEESGLSRKRIANTVRNLVHYELAVNEPVRYTITPAGIERSKFRPKTREEHNRLSVERIRAKREAQKVRGEVNLRKEADRVVKKAKASRDPLSMAWGVFGRVQEAA